jgi:thioredoxin reductase (NADPH)
MENYLGFPIGISGRELVGRAYTPAEKFGTQVLIATGARIPARTIVIATWAKYRKPSATSSRVVSRGWVSITGATFVEAQLCRGEEVIVVGGGPRQ